MNRKHQAQGPLFGLSLAERLALFVNFSGFKFEFNETAQTRSRRPSLRWGETMGGDGEGESQASPSAKVPWPQPLGRARTTAFSSENINFPRRVFDQLWTSRARESRKLR